MLDSGPWYTGSRPHSPVPSASWWVFWRCQEASLRGGILSRSGTPLWLTPATNSYMWWVVYVLSPAAARGGAISADSQHCVLHQPCTCYSFPFSYLFRPMPSFCVGVSFVVCLTCCWKPPLSHLHSVSRIPRRGVVDPLDSVSGSGARDGTPVYLFLLIRFLFWFWMLSSGVC